MSDIPKLSGFPKKSSVDQIKDAILCKLIYIVIGLSILDDRDVNDLDKLLRAWIEAANNER